MEGERNRNGIDEMLRRTADCTPNYRTALLQDQARRRLPRTDLNSVNLTGHKRGIRASYDNQTMRKRA